MGFAYHLLQDPKQRRISKASVRDRLVHQIVYASLTTIFDKKFIFHSLSSRLGKGTHIGVLLLNRMIKEVSVNGKHPCYPLKMDIKGFFDAINHHNLKALIRKNIKDEKALKIIDTIVDSFKVNNGALGPVGIPLGNATSQIFANIYFHELDDFIKQQLREKYYLSYCDDFIILSNNKDHLPFLITLIQEFLTKNLQLELHQKKLIIRKLSQCIGILTSHLDQKLQSYFGILSHANQHTVSQAMKNAYWVRSNVD